MALEIERKFLIDPNGFFKDYYTLPKSSLIEQGYLCVCEGKVVRIRIETPDQSPSKAEMCVKIQKSDTVREEYEYDIPVDDAIQMMKHVPNVIIKRRFYLPNGWVVDQFRSFLEGLYLAEYEAWTEDELDQIVVPQWAIADVTEEKTFCNSNLIGKKFVNGEIFPI